MTPPLVIDRVTAGYARGVDILSRVCMEIVSGGITGVIGLNGSGKSTLMKTIYGFLPPRSGRILLEGREINGHPPHGMLALGLWYIPQESGLFPYMTVEDNLKVLFPALKRIRSGVLDRAGELERAYEAFPVLGEKRRQVAGDLSGGERKMLELAKALVVRPGICLIDEPSVGLSPKLARFVYSKIKDLAMGGMSILMVDHSIKTVLELSDCFYVLHLGRIVDRDVPGRAGFDLKKKVASWITA